MQSLFIFAGWGTPPPGIRALRARGAAAAGRAGGRARLRAQRADGRAADRDVKENKQVFWPTHVYFNVI